MMMTNDETMFINVVIAFTISIQVFSPKIGEVIGAQASPTHCYAHANPYLDKTPRLLEFPF